MKTIFLGHIDFEKGAFSLCTQNLQALSRSLEGNRGSYRHAIIEGLFILIFENISMNLGEILFKKPM